MQLSVAAPTRSALRLGFSDHAVPFYEECVTGYRWPLPAPDASVVLLHGLQSHAGWFFETGDELVERGLAVTALDRRGSGSSPGARGDVARWQDWVDEVAVAVRLARRAHPEAPVHLVGHCFGANVGLAYALRDDPGIASLTMLTAGLHVLPDYTPGEKLRILAAGLTRPQARFRVPQNDELFTRDRAVLAWIRADRLGARTLTARALLQIGGMVRMLRARIGELELPLLVLEASRDRIADNLRNRALLERELGGRYSSACFEAEHFLLAEPCREAVLDELVRFTTNEEGL